jgi:hypothetical protein
MQSRVNCRTGFGKRFAHREIVALDFRFGRAVGPYACIMEGL